MLSHYLRGHTLAMTLNGVAFILLLFGCVVLHELGHALAARRYGIKTRDITLLPIGGVARLERMPDDPRQELVVALAGPAVNVVIAVALLAVLYLGEGLTALANVEFIGGGFLTRLMLVNVGLVLFNMLPAFPMDGGRVLRALLARRMSYVRATQIAASIGQAMAFIFGFLGLFSNPFLLFIALFVYMGAAQEASMAQMRFAFSGIPAREAMVTQFRTLSANDSLGKAIELLIGGYQQDFPVLDQDQLVGVLTRNGLVAGVGRLGKEALVREVMRRDFGTVDANEMLEIIFQKIQECECSSLPVIQQGRLVGIITPENIGEFVMIRSALQESRLNGGMPYHKNRYQGPL